MGLLLKQSAEANRWFGTIRALGLIRLFKDLRHNRAKLGWMEKDGVFEVKWTDLQGLTLPQCLTDPQDFHIGHFQPRTLEASQYP